MRLLRVKQQAGLDCRIWRDAGGVSGLEGRAAGSGSHTETESWPSRLEVRLDAGDFNSSMAAAACVFHINTPYSAAKDCEPHQELISK